MSNCTRCNEACPHPEARYCGSCGFPLLEDLSEEEVREQAQQQYFGFLDPGDVKAITECLNGEQNPPQEEYQWWLEEAIRWSFMHFTLLHQAEWFNKKSVLGRFVNRSVLEENPPEGALRDFYMLKGTFAFLYEVCGPVGLAHWIPLGASLAEGLSPEEEIDVTISVKEQRPGE